jgi:hypothetical protein
MTDIEEEYHFELGGLLLSNRYGGTLVASKNLKHLSKKIAMSSFNNDELELVIGNSPPAKFNKLLKVGYRVLYTDKSISYYYSLDGK